MDSGLLHIVPTVDRLGLLWGIQLMVIMNLLVIQLSLISVLTD